MLRGHVDQITRRLVSGWAADDEKPDAVVDVCFYVDGVQTAQIPCNTERPDLREKGYGEGLHGFRYQFESEFPLASEPRITLRFADTGDLLGDGDALLIGGQDPSTLLTGGQRVRPDFNDTRIRPLDWPPIAVDVRAPENLLAAMIERVESMFRHLGEVEPSESGAKAEQIPGGPHHRTGCGILRIRSRRRCVSCWRRLPGAESRKMGLIPVLNSDAALAAARFGWQSNFAR